MCLPTTCFVCRRPLDVAARNLNVTGGWAMIPASAAKRHKHERVAVCLSHAGVREEIIKLSGHTYFEKALDRWNQRELDTAVDLATDFVIRRRPENLPDTRIKFMDIEGVKALGVGFYRFVRVGGKYRFIDMDDGSHKDIVAPSEKAEGAGLIAVEEDRWILLNNYSDTLDVSATDDDVRRLAELLAPRETRSTCNV